MKIDLFDINEFIRVNKCPEVTNPSAFNADKTFTTDGLFSHELFGLSEYERKTTFGYIKLPKHYIHPAVFTILNTRMGNLKKIISGELRAKVDSRGNIIYVKEDDPDFDKAETGIDFFYNNFEKIKWTVKNIGDMDSEEDVEEIDSLDKRTRIKFLRSLKKEEFFVDKWLVLPPFYRDVNPEKSSMGDYINKLYKELIIRSQSMMNIGSFDLFGVANDYKIQLLLYDIYQECIKPLTGKSVDQKNPRVRTGSPKNSLLRQNILGKTIDYSAGNVIIANDIAKANRFEDMQIKYGYCGFPLITAMTCFYPFVLNELVHLLETFIREQEAYNPKIKKIDTKQYDVKRAEKLIKLFIRTPDKRSEPITYEYIDHEGKKREGNIYLVFGRDKDFKDYFISKVTYLHLMYFATKSAVKDKHAYVTRHPVTNFQNIFPAKVKVLTTERTQKIWIKLRPDSPNNQADYYEDFPLFRVTEPGEKIKPDSKYDLTDAFVPGNLWLDALNGDFDGDMLYIKGLFSKEANEEADRLINSKAQLLGADGKPSRTILSKGGDQVICLYELTKEVPVR